MQGGQFPAGAPSIGAIIEDCRITGERVARKLLIVCDKKTENFGDDSKLVKDSRDSGHETAYRERLEWT